MRSTSYLSTSQTAQMLGLSVGTVQRMVESGALQAYTTEGGHRRILASSIRQYCQNKGLSGAVLPPVSARVCVVHPPDAEPEMLAQLDRLPHVQRVSHPLELAGLHDEFGVFFIDARVSWLDWPDLHRPQALGPQAHLIVYHAEALSPEHQALVARQARLQTGGISADLVQGYLLALAKPHRGREAAGATTQAEDPAPPRAPVSH